MTTIAFKNGALACDKQATDDNQITKTTKWVEDGDTVYVLTGHLVTGLRFMEWLKGESEMEHPPKLSGTSVCEFDLKTGKLKVWEDRWVPLPIEDGIYGMGSGGQFAIGAMAAGASPEEAVKIASKYDAFTGRGIKSWQSSKAQTRNTTS